MVGKWAEGLVKLVVGAALNATVFGAHARVRLCLDCQMRGRMQGRRAWIVGSWLGRWLRAGGGVCVCGCGLRPVMGSALARADLLGNFVAGGAVVGEVQREV